MLTNEEIIRELNRMDVTFFDRDGSEVDAEPVDPEVLMASMASSDDAQVRLALIALLFRRPVMGKHAPAAAEQLSGVGLIFLRCYYTAAVVLREKYAEQIEVLGLSLYPIDDWFSEDLGVTASGDPDERLRQVAQRQGELTTNEIEWEQAYYQSAIKFLRDYAKSLVK